MAKYSNLTCGIKVLANDENSFNLSLEGMHFIQWISGNVSRLPKKSEIQESGFSGLFKNLDDLYTTMVAYHSGTMTKKERKSSLKTIVRLEYDVCKKLGMTKREINGEVEDTATITINQYEFFEACFSIKHASKKVRSTTNNIIDVVSLTQFKKAVVFGLCEGCKNDGTLYIK